ncbi:hypothetical protein vseg_007984 [Gypsophila vaccaria]
MAPGEAERLIAANDALTEAVRALAREKTRDATTTAASMSGVIARQHPPEVDGTGDPVVLEDWLRHFGKIFITVGCPDSLRVEQAACYLKGRADYGGMTIKTTSSCTTNLELMMKKSSVGLASRKPFEMSSFVSISVMLRGRSSIYSSKRMGCLFRSTM